MTGLLDADRLPLLLLSAAGCLLLASNAPDNTAFYDVVGWVATVGAILSGALLVLTALSSAGRTVRSRRAPGEPEVDAGG